MEVSGSEKEESKSGLSQKVQAIRSNESLLLAAVNAGVGQPGVLNSNLAGTCLRAPRTASLGPSMVLSPTPYLCLDSLSYGIFFKLNCLALFFN